MCFRLVGAIKICEVNRVQTAVNSGIRQNIASHKMYVEEEERVSPIDARRTGGIFIAY